MSKLVMKVAIICGLLVVGSSAMAAETGEKSQADLAKECCEGGAMNVTSAACSALVEAVKSETGKPGTDGKKTDTQKGG